MRGLREVCRGGLGVIALAAIGCGGTYDHSSDASFKRVFIGREMVAIAAAKVVVVADVRDPWRQGSPMTLPGGTRLRIVRAIHIGEFFLRMDEKSVYATIIGRESDGYVRVGGYQLDPLRLENLGSPLLLLPRTPPSWLDLKMSPPSAAAADVGMLQLAMRQSSDDATPAFAAHELLRRAFDTSDPDHESARKAIVAFARAGEPYSDMRALYRGFVGMPANDRDDFISLVRAATRPTTRHG